MNTHAHRFRIDEPNGVTSKGICSGCGLERQFWNTLAIDRPGRAAFRNSLAPKVREPFEQRLGRELDEFSLVKGDFRGYGNHAPARRTARA